MPLNLVIFLFICPIIFNCKNYLIKVNDTNVGNRITNGINANTEASSSSGSDYFFRSRNFFRRLRYIYLEVTCHKY